MRPILRTITLERRGMVNTCVAGDRHCGAQSSVVDGTVDVKYDVRLVVGPNDLDYRGFLVDQEALHRVMVTIASDPVPWREPCELLAVVWGERLLTWVTCENTACTVHELSLSLSPFPHGGTLSANFRTLDQQSRAVNAVRTAA